MTLKPRLYYLLGNSAKIEPISGDRINEIGLIRALSAIFEVYYNGTLCDPKDDVFGRDDGEIVVPKSGEYDLIYVRANRDVFLQAEGKKLWFASPYDPECFEQADGIVCMTLPWKERLQSYSAVDYEYFDRTYPMDMVAPKNCYLFPQVVNVPSDAELAELRSSVKPTPNRTLKHRILSQLGLVDQAKPFIIRHFGPIRPTNFPHQLVYELQRDRYLARRLTAECVGPGRKQFLPQSIRSIKRVDQKVATRMLATSDAIWYNQHASGNIAGSLKVLEAMAVGVPVLSPRWDARVEELGQDYRFFWTPSTDKKFSDVRQPEFRSRLLELIDIRPVERTQLSEELRDRANLHSIGSVARYLEAELEPMMGSFCR